MDRSVRGDRVVNQMRRNWFPERALDNQANDVRCSQDSNRMYTQGNTFTRRTQHQSLLGEVVKESAIH
jgi:hypothetical protein